MVGCDLLILLMLLAALHPYPQSIREDMKTSLNSQNIWVQIGDHKSSTIFQNANGISIKKHEIVPSQSSIGPVYVVQRNLFDTAQHLPTKNIFLWRPKDMTW